MRKILLILVMSFITLNGYSLEPQVTFNVAKYQFETVSGNTHNLLGVRFNTRTCEVSLIKRVKGERFYISELKTFPTGFSILDPNEKNTWNGRFQIKPAPDKFATFWVQDTFNGDVYFLFIFKIDSGRDHNGNDFCKAKVSLTKSIEIEEK